MLGPQDEVIRAWEAIITAEAACATVVLIAVQESTVAFIKEVEF
jgi:hypothetical protein